MTTDLDEKVTFRLDDSLLRKLDETAQAEDLSKSELIRELIKKHLESQDEEILIENLKEKVLELNPDWDPEELEGKSAAYLSGVIEQTEELREKYGKDSKEDSTGVPAKSQYIKDKQRGLETKYQQNFDLTHQIISNAKRLKADGILPEGLNVNDKVEVKKWCLANKKQINDNIDKIKRLG